MSKKRSGKSTKVSFTPSPVQATEFSLVDCDGHICALLTTDPATKLPLLRFFQGGNERLQIGVSSNGPGLNMLRPEGGIGLSIGVNQDGAFGIVVCHADGKIAFRVLATPGGDMHAAGYDKDGQTIWTTDKRA